jgi:hypothetical protein
MENNRKGTIKPAYIYDLVDWNSRCSFCMNDSADHTVEEHETSIANALRRECDRYQSLMRAAKKQYESA